MPRAKLTQESRISPRETAVCERLREWRKSSGLIQKDVARRLEIPAVTLQSYEYARVPLRWGIARRLCHEFDLNQRWLATGGGPQTPSLTISSDIERFVPVDLLFTAVFDRLIEPLLRNEESANREVGVNETREDIESLGEAIPLGIAPIRDASLKRKIIRRALSLELLCLPAELLDEFSEQLDRLVVAFNKKHKRTINSDLQKRSPDRAINNMAIALAEQAFVVSKALDIRPERAIESARQFPSSDLEEGLDVDLALIESALRKLTSSSAK